MPKRWLDLLERGLLILLAGFLFLPNALPTLALAALAVIRLFRSHSEVNRFRSWWLLTPAILILIAWLLHGMSSTGTNELSLWGIWLLSILYWFTSPFKQTFFSGFIGWSLLQSIWVGWTIFTNLPIPLDGFAQTMRDLIGTVHGVHPTYMSAAWLWAAILAFRSNAFGQWARIGTGTILLLMGMLAGGKMAFIAAMLVGLLMILTQLTGSRRMVLASALVITAMIMLLLNPGISTRMEEISNVDLSYSTEGNISSTELRIGVWKCASEVFSEHWIKGVGVGNVRPHLESCFKAYERSEFFETEFNSHNQYLHFGLTGGVLSMIAFLAFFVFLFAKAWSRKDIWLGAFLIYFCLLMLTENYFSRQSGMLLWSLHLLPFLFAHKGSSPSAATSSSM